MSDETPADYAVGICQRSGFKVKASSLRPEWTGLLVRARDWEPKHPMLDLPAPRGERVRDDATGPDVDNDVGDVSGAPSLGDLPGLVNGGS